MTNALTTTPIRELRHVREIFLNRAVRESMEAVATGHLGPERLLRVAMGACQTTPALLDCTPMSFLRGLMTCAKLGLEPNNEFGHVYLIPFKNKRAGITECQMIPGYKGFMELAMRHPAVVAIHADVVYSDDELWSYEYGSDMHLRHKPGPKEGEKTHAYCFVRLKDGQAFTVLPWTEVERRKMLSQGWRYAEQNGKRDSPWHTHEDRMGRKTAIRNMASGGEMPMATEMMDLLLADDGKMPAFDLDARGKLIEGAAVPDGDDVIERESDAPKEGAGTGAATEKPAGGHGAAAGRRPAQKQDAGQRAAQTASGGTERRPAAGKKPEPEPEPEPDSDEGDPESWPEVIAGTMERILNDVAGAESEADLAGIEALWEDTIPSIKANFPDAGAAIDEALQLAQERLTGEGAE